MVRRQAKLLENGQRIAKRKANALEHRASEVRSRMRETQSQERAARGCVSVRRAFALEVWKERDAIRARRDRRRFLAKPLARLARVRQVASKLLAKPRERPARGKHDAH